MPPTRRILRLLAVAAGTLGGLFLGLYLYNIAGLQHGGRWLLFTCVLYGGGVAYLLVPYFERVVTVIRNYLRFTPPQEILSGIFGTIAGLIIAGLVANFIHDLPYGIPLGIAGAIILALLGARVGSTRGQEFFGLFGIGSKKNKEEDKKGVIIDSSAIIDGRLEAIVKTGWLGKNLTVTHAVARELQRLADSADLAKHARGRRGLDLLLELQKTPGLTVRILDGPPSEGMVDDYLIQLSREIDFPIVTTDSNLTQLARVEEVTVLNLHEIAAALKPTVLPGESLKLVIAREGREAGQGVGHLEDGTMVVIEGARPFLGRSVEVQVEQILQTASGRMVFARMEGTKKARRDSRETKER